MMENQNMHEIHSDSEDMSEESMEFDECGLLPSEWNPANPEIYRAGSEEKRITRIAEFIADRVDKNDYTKQLLKENVIEITCTPSAMNYKIQDGESRYSDGFRDWIIRIGHHSDTARWNNTLLKTMICLPKDNDEIRYEIIAQIQLILSGGSELMKAIWKGSLETVHELLLQGIDVNYKNYRGVSALALAVNPWMFSEAPSRLSDIRIVRELIKFGADMEVLNNRGQCLVEIALNILRKDVASLLIKSGAQVRGLSSPCLRSHWQTLADIALAIDNRDFTKYIIMARTEVCTNIVFLFYKVIHFIYLNNGTKRLADIGHTGQISKCNFSCWLDMDHIALYYRMAR